MIKYQIQVLAIVAALFIHANAAGLDHRLRWDDSDAPDGSGKNSSQTWSFDALEEGSLPEGWRADGAIEVRLKAMAGSIDQGGGIVWRVRNRDNYYITRWNPLENNIRLYHVFKGSAVSWPVPMSRLGLIQFPHS
jgi:hypothetical protein